MANTVLGHLSSGEAVFDRPNSHLHGGVLPFLPEALGKIEAARRDFITEEVDFGRFIGETVCVATGPGDTIVFAQRPRRNGLTRFVLNRVPESCSTLVVIIKAATGVDAGSYVVVTAFVGRRPRHEPWDRHAEAGALEWWAERALIWGAEPAQCGWCSSSIDEPNRAVPVGDLIVCVKCADIVPRRLVSREFPGWGSLRAPCK